MEKAHTHILEYNIVEHCNLSCNGCSHLSPHLSRFAVQLEDVRRDLYRLASMLSVGELKIMGGEPLLHGELESLLKLVRESELARKVTIVSNGILVLSAPKTLWRLIDRLRISVYPGVKLKMDFIKELARAEGFELQIQNTQLFKYTYLPNKNTDRDLVERIFRACALPGHYSCHTLRNGYYFKCTPAAYFPEAFGSSEDLDSFASDGFAIHDTFATARTLGEFLKIPRPFGACNFCLGSSGKAYPHSLGQRGSPIPRAPFLIEEVLDYEDLKKNQGRYLEEFDEDHFDKFFERHFEVYKPSHPTGS